MVIMKFRYYYFVKYDYPTAITTMQFIIKLLE